MDSSSSTTLLKGIVTHIHDVILKNIEVIFMALLFTNSSAMFLSLHTSGLLIPIPAWNVCVPNWYYQCFSNWNFPHTKYVVLFCTFNSLGAWSLHCIFCWEIESKFLKLEWNWCLPQFSSPFPYFQVTRSQSRKLYHRN